MIGFVGNAVMPLALFSHDVDFIAGPIEHAISTLPWALWTGVVGYRMWQPHAVAAASSK